MSVPSRSTQRTGLGATLTEGVAVGDSCAVPEESCFSESSINAVILSHSAPHSNLVLSLIVLTYVHRYFALAAMAMHQSSITSSPVMFHERLAKDLDLWQNPQRRYFPGSMRRQA